MFRFDRNRHGVNVPIKKQNVTPAALASLRIALRSYFETYQIARHRLSLKNLNHSNGTSEQSEFCATLIYQEKYTQTIFHFHHFLELFMKDNLRVLHPALASKMDFSNNGKQLLNILNGQGGCLFDSHSVEYDKAYKRLTSLREHPNAPAICQTLMNYGDTVSTLNELRNRSWHKGTYVLRYTELDEFIGGNVLPLVIECLDTPPYNDLLSFWKYTTPTVAVDPIKRIIAAASKSTIDFREIAFFKAVGRASYNVSNYRVKMIGIVERESEVKAKAMTNWSSDFHSVRKCFVCGHNALLLHEDHDYEYDATGNIQSYWSLVYAATCESCGLDLQNDVGNPQEYGINEPDLWFAVEH